mgnify:FL=1|jgi:N,N'-diacetyllegionaminate synthase|tara:strand:+ start:747 stop:1754 length:1008 start_codon:yes stop_codon:yes gene_type:complete
MKVKNKIFIIAEAGVNHNGSIKKAFELIKVAKKAGADGVKFQIFDKYEQISNIAETAPYQNKATNKKKMLDMAKNYDFEWKNHIKLKKFCNKINIEYLASVFDKKSVDFYLKTLKAKTIKIASSEIDNLRLLKYINNNCNSVILSTGMSSITEIQKAIKILSNVKYLSLLQCTSLYPTKIEDVNLNVLKTFKDKFKLPIGFSDHTTGNISAIISVGLGASIIEKHFTLNKKLPGPDHKMSLNSNELTSYISEIREAEKSLGSENKIANKEEKLMIKYARRGLFAARNIKKDKIITHEDICYKRPAIYTSISDEKKLLGRKAKLFIKEGSPIKKNT